MNKIENNAKTIKRWLEHLDFEHEHPGYGQDIYEKLDEIIYEETQKAAYEEQLDMSIKENIVNSYISYSKHNSSQANDNSDLQIAIDKAKELTSNTPDGIIRDADTILEDYMKNRETEVSGIAEEIFEIYKNTSDKESIKAMFETLVGVSFDDYVEECIKNTTKNTNNN